MLTAKIKELFRKLSVSKTLIITIGNSLRSDDGFGPYIAQHFKSTNKNFILLNAEDKPENAIDEAVSIMPEKVLIIDAADFGGSPGEARIIDKDHIPDSTLSTHTFPLKVIAKLLEEDTKAEVYFLGVQPAKVELGEGLSPYVKATGDDILKLMQSL